MAEDGARPPGRTRKQVLLRLDPAVHDAMAKWAADDLRSVNAQIEYLLTQAARQAGRHKAPAAPPQEQPTDPAER